MRRKAVAGIALLGTLAVAALLWAKTRSHPPSERAEADIAAAASGDNTATRRATRASMKREPIGTLRLEGQVIDAKDSAPIGGATVTLASDPPRTAMTEADGSFAFDGLLAQRYRVSAWKDAMYADAVQARVTATSEPVALRMKLGTTIDIAVTAGAGGAPIAGAHVRVDDERTIDSDARGIAEVRGLGTFSHDFEVTADGWAPAARLLMVEAEATGTRTIAIALTRGAALAGAVVDPSGHPVADADVWIARDALHRRVTADATGAWRFPVLAAGHYEVGAESELLAPSDNSSIDLDGAHDRRGVVLRLTRGTDAVGTVVDSKGVPVGLARVHLQGLDWNSAINADAQGRFAFRGMPPRSFQLYATSDTRASPMVLFDGTKGADDLRLVLAEATIEGTIVDEAGAPVAEAEVDAQQLSAMMIVGYGDADVSDSRGRFTIGPLPDASYGIGARWPGVGHDIDTYMHHESVTAKPGQHDVKVVLPAAGMITGVVTMGGKPLAHYAVAIDGHDGYGFAIGTIVSRSDGRFTRHAVPPDTWRLGIIGDDAELHVIDDVKVEAGKTTDLGTIDLPPARRVHGRVVDSASAAVAGADVLVGTEVIPFMLQVEGDPLRSALQGARHVTTGPDGRFDVALSGTTAPGVQKIAAFGPAGARSPEVTIPDDDRDLVLQLAASSAIRGEVRGVGGGVDVRASGAGFAVATTDGYGRYQMDGLAPGHYTVSAIRLDSMQQSTQAEVDVGVGATATADLAFPTGGVTLVVLGAHGDRECFVSLVHGDAEKAAWAGGAACADRVELSNIPPDTYQLCANSACRDVTVTATPLEQTIDLSSTK